MTVALDELLAAIHANPDDHVPRLVYADLMLERGDPLGELIHIDCAMASLPVFDPERSRLGHRRTELFDAHLRDGWLDWYGYEWFWPRFCFGFIEGIHYKTNAKNIDIENLDATLETMFDRWADRECRCGARHDPLMWVTPDRKFPLVRRFGGIQFSDIERHVSSFDARKTLELRLLGDGDWGWVGAIHSIQTIVISTCGKTDNLEYTLGLPNLVEIAFDRSPLVAYRMAALGIPKGMRRISIEPSCADPIRDALIRTKRPFVENERPSGDELVLVTDMKRFHDLAFIDRPIMADDDPAPVPLDDATRTGLELPGDVPSPDWPLRGRIDVKLGHPQVAVSSMAKPMNGNGIVVGSYGPLYVRVDGVTPRKPIMIVWRMTTTAPWLQVFAGSEVVEAPMPTNREPNNDWVFIIPELLVRDTAIQLTIIGPRTIAYTLGELRYYQPA